MATNDRSTSKKFFYAAGGGERRGPVTSQELRQHAASGRLSPSDMVWQEGVDKGVPARNVRGLFAAASGAKSTGDKTPKTDSPERPATSPPPKSQVNVAPTASAPVQSPWIIVRSICEIALVCATVPTVAAAATLGTPVWHIFAKDSIDAKETFGAALVSQVPGFIAFSFLLMALLKSRLGILYQYMASSAWNAHRQAEPSESAGLTLLLLDIWMQLRTIWWKYVTGSAVCIIGLSGAFGAVASVEFSDSMRVATSEDIDLGIVTTLGIWSLGALVAALTGCGLYMFGLYRLQVAKGQLQLSRDRRLNVTDARGGIVYFRAFQDDHSWAKLPFRRLMIGEEEALVNSLSRVRSVFAIGRRGELPPAGARRMCFDDDEWQIAATRLMRDASFVLIRPNVTTWLLWELKQVIAACQPERLILWVPASIPDDRWQQFCQTAESECGIQLPLRRNKAQFYVFDAAGLCYAIATVRHLRRVLKRRLKNGVAPRKKEQTGQYLTAKIRFLVRPSLDEAFEWEHSGPRIRIGRGGDCQLNFRGELAELVSSAHAEVVLSPAGALITDLRSTNGTYINDVPLAGAMRLAVGDQIQLGRAGPRLEVLSFGATFPAPSRRGPLHREQVDISSAAEAAPDLNGTAVWLA